MSLSLLLFVVQWLLFVFIFIIIIIPHIAKEIPLQLNLILFWLKNQFHPIFPYMSHKCVNIWFNLLILNACFFEFTWNCNEIILGNSKVLVPLKFESHSLLRAHNLRYMSVYFLKFNNYFQWLWIAKYDRFTAVSCLRLRLCRPIN